MTGFSLLLPRLLVFLKDFEISLCGFSGMPRRPFSPADPAKGKFWCFMRRREQRRPRLTLCMWPEGL